MKKFTIEEFVLEEFDQPKKEIDNEQTKQKELKNEPSNQTTPDIDKIYQKAFSEGYEKSKTEITNTFEQQIANLKNEYELKLSSINAVLQKSIQAFDNKLNELKNTIGQIEKDIVNISIDIAQKIIEKEIQNPDTIKNLIKKSLSFAKSEKLKIKLNLDQAKQIENEFENIQIIGDPALAMGSIIIEEDSNIIDASINTKLEELKRSLINES